MQECLQNVKDIQSYIANKNERAFYTIQLNCFLGLSSCCKASKDLQMAKANLLIATQTIIQWAKSKESSPTVYFALNIVISIILLAEDFNCLTPDELVAPANLALLLPTPLDKKYYLYFCCLIGKLEVEIGNVQSADTWMKRFHAASLLLPDFETQTLPPSPSSSGPKPSSSPAPNSSKSIGDSSLYLLAPMPK